MSTIVFRSSVELPPAAAILAVPVLADLAAPESAAPWPDGLRAEDLAALGFEGKAGQAQALAVGGGRLVLAVGMGDAEKLGPDSFRRAGACLVRSAWKVLDVAASILDAVPAGMDRAVAAQALVEGAGMAAYRFTAYRRQPDACRIERFTVLAADSVELQAAVDRGAHVARAVWLAQIGRAHV